jgi:hypothetical protein
VRGIDFNNASAILLGFYQVTYRRQCLPSRSRIYIRQCLLLDPLQKEALFLCGPLVVEEYDVEVIHDAIIVGEAWKLCKAADAVITLGCNNFDLVGYIMFTVVTEGNNVWSIDGLDRGDGT